MEYVSAVQLENHQILLELSAGRVHLDLLGLEASATGVVMVTGLQMAPPFVLTAQQELINAGIW